MPSKYKYPDDFTSMTKQGMVSDVDPASLYREKQESDLLGSSRATFSQMVEAKSDLGSKHTPLNKYMYTSHKQGIQD